MPKEWLKEGEERARFRSEEQRPNFVRLEEAVLNRWEKDRTFEQSVERRRCERLNGEEEGCEKFVFVEGPPTANGLPHPGHILTRVVKDLVLRYKTMQGFLVERKAGWDTHGLPVEIEVEKELGLNSKREIEEFGIEEFNRKCKDSVFRYEREWVSATKRVGFWLDMNSPYITFENAYIESVWWSLKEIWKKGLLYRGHKVVPYCPRCETTLSSHEVAQGYKEVEDPSIFVSFRLKHEDASLLAWTTTPWTLFGNVALAVHPEHTYAKVRLKGSRKEEILILAEARLEALELEGLEGEYEVTERLKGTDLEGKEYEPLFEVSVEGEAHKVVTADFVSLEEGTGVVHIAPAFGADDYEVCKQKGLGFSQPVNSKGRFTSEVPSWLRLEGVFVKDADRRIIEVLEQRGVLFKESAYLHSYPFCWRCGSPLLYYARESWFVGMRSLRDRLLANNEKINWFPAHLKHGRFGNFLESIEDWALSRERFWGTPLNIWVCEKCGTECCVGSVAELRERATSSVPSNFDLHRPGIDEVVLKCEGEGGAGEGCGGEMRRVKDVIDCWYDSGSAPFAQWHYPFAEGEEKKGGEGKGFKQNFPADFITEAIDQTRGWFYSLLAVSTAIFDAPPYLNVLSLGHILDEKGVKMSKSKGNVVDLNSIFTGEGAAGADALRWYLYTAGPLWDDIRFSEPAVKERQKKFLNTLWNSYFFFVTYASIDEFNPAETGKIPVGKRSALDRWVVSRLNSLTQEVVGAIERFEIHTAARKIEEFVVADLSNWFIRRSRRRFWVPEENFDKDCAYLTLYEVLVSLCKLLAPFVPFVTEHIYQNLVGAVSEKEEEEEEERESVHFCDYPSADESLVDAELEDSMSTVSKLVEAGRRARSDAGIKIRQPLNEVVVVCSGEKQERNKQERNKERQGQARGESVVKFGLEEVVREELNVREVRFKEVFDGGKEYKKVEVEVNGEDGVGTSLFLDTSLDKNLLEEGLVRDLVRRVQGMRKELDLEYTARIKISFVGDEEVKEAVKNFSDYICEETLAVGIEEGKPSASSSAIYEKRWKIGKKQVLLGIIRT